MTIKDNLNVATGDVILATNKLHGMWWNTDDEVYYVLRPEEPYDTRYKGGVTVSGETAYLSNLPLVKLDACDAEIIGHGYKDYAHKVLELNLHKLQKSMNYSPSNYTYPVSSVRTEADVDNIVNTMQSDLKTLEETRQYLNEKMYPFIEKVEASQVTYPKHHELMSLAITRLTDLAAEVHEGDVIVLSEKNQEVSPYHSVIVRVESKSNRTFKVATPDGIEGTVRKGTVNTVDGRLLDVTIDGVTMPCNYAVIIRLIKPTTEKTQAYIDAKYQEHANIQELIAAYRDIFFHEDTPQFIKDTFQEYAKDKYSYTSYQWTVSPTLNYRAWDLADTNPMFDILNSALKIWAIILTAITNTVRHIDSAKDFLSYEGQRLISE